MRFHSEEQQYHSTGPRSHSSFAPLPSKLLQFQVPQRRERNARERNRHPRPNVSAVASEPDPNGPLIPHLIHTDNGARPPDQKRKQRRDPHRQPLLVLPRRPIKRHASQCMEDQMLLDHYRQPRTDPVTHERQEVFEDIEQMVAARYRAHELNDHEDETPDPTGDGFGIATQDLAAQTRGVRGWRIIRDAAESEKHGAETSKGTEAVVAGQEERTG